MKIWIWTAILLAAFDVLLLTSYFKKKTLVEQTYQQIMAEPDVEDARMVSENITMTFLAYLYGPDSVENKKFFTVSRNLNRNLASLASFDDAEEGFFSKKTGVPSLLQDSLWLAVQNYRRIIDKLLPQAIALRMDFRQRYAAALKIVKLNNEVQSKNQKKLLQASLDSVTQFPGIIFRIRISLDNTRELKNLLSFMERKSNLAVELKMNNDIHKFDNLFISKGKAQWYGKYFNLSELTVVERRIFFRKAVIAKSLVDKSFYDLKLK